MEKLLTFQYYFATRPNPDFQYTKLTLLVIGLLFVLSIVLIMYRKKFTKDKVSKKILKRYPMRFFTFGVILMFLLLAREAGIPYISMRLWWLLLFIYIIYWSIKVCLGFSREHKKRSNKTESSRKKVKYLPKKKK